MNEYHPQALEEQLRTALDRPCDPDFETWQNCHGEALAYLNPVVTSLYLQKRRLFLRVASTTAAALLIVAVASVFLFCQQESFAQAVKIINKARTTCYTQTIYSRFFSKDGKRTWLKKECRMDIAYQVPNLYKVTSYDKEGRTTSIDVMDTIRNKTLHLDMKSKKASWQNAPSNFHFGPGNPLGWISKTLESKPLELVGQRDVNGIKVNVFRSHREKSQTSFDIWLDAKTKRVVGFTDPGADCFDLLTAADRNNPSEKRFSKAELAGTIGSNIVYDAPLDTQTFNMTPPEGFTVVEQPPRPPITEVELIEWLGVTARFNHGKFVDTPRGIGLEQHNKAAQKKKRDRTKVENRYLNAWRKHMNNHHSCPIQNFADQCTVAGTFRYLGKGVELGTKDRIVCWYKLINTTTYRAVYGDLTVKKVTPEELPLPVVK